MLHFPFVAGRLEGDLIEAERNRLKRANQAYGVSIDTSGIMPTPPVKASENKTGQALSAIGGNIPISITDPAHQTQDLNTIRRDTNNTNTSLPGLPDLEHVLRDQYKTQAALQAAQATMAGLVGDIATNLYDNAKTQAERDLWAEGGQGRALLHAIGGGILGGVNGWEGAIKGALGGEATALMAPAIANLVKGMLKDSTLSDQDKQALANLIGTSLSSAVGGVVGGGEGGSYGAANYQYNYLNNYLEHEQARELTDAEKALEACKVSPTTCSATDKALLQSQVDSLKSLDYQTTMSLLQACMDKGALSCTIEQGKWQQAYQTWMDANKNSSAEANDPDFERMGENYKNLAAAGIVARELAKTQEYGEVYQMTKGFKLGAVSGAAAALGTISVIAGQEAVSTVVATCGRSSVCYASYLNMALHDVVATTSEFGGSPTAATPYWERRSPRLERHCLLEVPVALSTMHRGQKEFKTS